MGTRVTTRNGSVGPHYDPYIWDELEVTRLGHTVILRNCALRGDQLTVDGNVELANCLGNEAEERFEELVGFPAHKIYGWYQESRMRCNCGCRDVDCVDGHPGETLYICTKCKTIISADFSEAAIY